MGANATVRCERLARALARCAMAAALGVATPGTSMQAADAGDVSAYDLGYAAKAAEVCPDLDLVSEISEAAAAEPDFRKGVTTVEENVSALGVEKSCRFAKRLYDSTSGKAAPLLKSK